MLLNTAKILIADKLANVFCNFWAIDCLLPASVPKHGSWTSGKHTDMFIGMIRMKGHLTMKKAVSAVRQRHCLIDLVSNWPNCLQCCDNVGLGQKGHLAIPKDSTLDTCGDLVNTAAAV